MQNKTTLHDRGNFRFVVDLEWDKYTGYYDRELEYDDVLMDHKYYLESVFKGAMSANEENEPKRPEIDYGKGVRVMIINEVGQFIDKADYEAEQEENMDEKEREELARLRAAEGIGREIMMIEEQTDRLAKIAKVAGNEVDLSEVSKASQMKINLDSIVDEKSLAMKKFYKRIGSGGIWMFVISLVIFSYSI